VPYIEIRVGSVSMFVLLSLWIMFFWSTEWREYERQCTQCAYNKKRTNVRMSMVLLHRPSIAGEESVRRRLTSYWRNDKKRKKMLTLLPEFTGLVRLKTSGWCNPSFSISTMMSSKSCAFYVGILFWFSCLLANIYVQSNTNWQSRRSISLELIMPIDINETKYFWLWSIFNSAIFELKQQWLYVR